MWDLLDKGWQTAFELAWNSYLKGTIPIGAVIQDETGEIVSQGQNLIFTDKKAPPPLISDHKLAHAEINTLLGISEKNHPRIREYTLTTTMEPCPLCFGAIVMANIRHFRFAARDRVAGAAKVNRLHDYIASKNIAIEGPHELLEAIQLAMQTCFELERNPAKSGYLISQWELDCPKGIQLGRLLYEKGVLAEFKSRKALTQSVLDELERLYLEL